MSNCVECLGYCETVTCFHQGSQLKAASCARCSSEMPTSASENSMTEFSIIKLCGLGLWLRVRVVGSVDPNLYPYPNPHNNHNTNPTLTLIEP